MYGYYREKFHVYHFWELKGYIPTFIILNEKFEKPVLQKII